MVEYSPIPEPVRELLRNRVHAIEHIEVLLLLRAEMPTAVTLVAIATRLRLTEALVRGALSHLAAHGLVVESAAGWRYEPGTLTTAVDGLAACYDDARVELLRLISANAVERLRSGSLKIFAEAFRLRRGKKQDG